MVEHIGKSGNRFSLSLSGKHYWINRRGLTINEIRSRVVDADTDGSEGVLDSCFNYSEMSVSVRFGVGYEYEEVLLFKDGKVVREGVEIVKRDVPFAREIPIVCDVKENSSEDCSDGFFINSRMGFDPSMFRIETEELEIEGKQIKVVVGCVYGEDRLMFACSGETDVTRASECVFWSGTYYKISEQNRLPDEIYDSAFCEHILNLEKQCVVRGVTYYGAWSESDEEYLKKICISVPDNVRCNCFGCYECEKVLEPDGMTNAFEIKRRESSAEKRYIYDATKDVVASCR